MDIGTVITATILALLIFFRDWLKERKEKREKVKKQEIKEHNSGIEFLNDIERKVRHAENKIKFTYRAMRIYVIHFSNGIFTEAGLSLLKVTFAHEVLEDYYVEPIAKHFQEKPLPEMLISPITNTVREGEYYLKDIELLDKKDPNHKTYYTWLISYKVKSVLWLSMKNKAGKMVAILVLHFPVANHLTEVDISKIKDMKTEIERVYDSL